MTKHVAGSGARAGQWVNCTAKNSCRLGGTHISERELYAAGAWLNETGDKKRLSQISKEDVEKFQASTKGQEEEWAKKAELAARRAKGIKGNNYQIFSGEKNLVEVTEPSTPKKFVPNTGQNKAAGQPKLAVTPLPPGTRYIEIPGVARFMNRGDTAALAQAIHDYKIPRETVVAMASLRARMTNNAPHSSIYTNSTTGENYKGSEIPEVKEFLQTGNEAKLTEAAKAYDLGDGYVEALKESQRRHEKKEKREARKSKNAAPAPRTEESTVRGLSAAVKKMKEASTRFTNVTDDMGDLTSEPNPTKRAPSGKTIYEALAEAKTVSERAARNRPTQDTNVRANHENASKNTPVNPEPKKETPVTPADKIALSLGRFTERLFKKG